MTTYPAHHHAFLVDLQAARTARGWKDIEEIPGGVDLWATKGGVRVIFEAKTLTPQNELGQTRSALAQLLEYRFFAGGEGDRLCLLTNAPISDHRLRFLEVLGIAVAWSDGHVLHASGRLAQELIENHEA